MHAGTWNDRARSSSGTRSARAHGVETSQQFRWFEEFAGDRGGTARQRRWLVVHLPPVWVARSWCSSPAPPTSTRSSGSPALPGRPKQHGADERVFL